MLRVEETEVMGFRGAIRGMRNAMNSWSKADSYTDDNGVFVIGSNDLKLLLGLTMAGPSHRKAIRMIHVQMDVTAPLYWWKEFDTYKVSTTANSCSTMHKLHANELTLEDFSNEHLDETNKNLLMLTIDNLNFYRDKFNKHQDKKDWWQLIQTLPSSFNQKRTLDFNYETALAILDQRRRHKLDEWREQFCNDLLEQLPYLKELDDRLNGGR